MVGWIDECMHACKGLLAHPFPTLSQNTRNNKMKKGCPDGMGGKDGMGLGGILTTKGGANASQMSPTHTHVSARFVFQEQRSKSND